MWNIQYECQESLLFDVRIRLEPSYAVASSVPIRLEGQFRWKQSDHQTGATIRQASNRGSVARSTIPAVKVGSPRPDSYSDHTWHCALDGRAFMDSVRGNQGFLWPYRHHFVIVVWPYGRTDHSPGVITGVQRSMAHKKNGHFEVNRVAMFEQWCSTCSAEVIRFKVPEFLRWRSAKNDWDRTRPYLALRAHY